MPPAASKKLQDRLGRAREILAALKKTYPTARCSLDYGNAFQLLIATILSAQCTDERVNMVTPGIFRKYPTAAKLAQVPQEELEKDIQSTGFYRNKAKALQVLAARLQEKERRERAEREAATRKSLIGSGDRSDRIRTYNFPQGRLTDHRINLTLYQLGSILEGELEPVVSALRNAHETEQLAALEASVAA
jgi:hypothetical protein